VTCHCGKGASFETCCAPLLKGEKKAKTAEELMRSRYSAFVEANIDYIMDTHHPETVKDIDRDGTLEWAKESEWLGMEILETEAGGETDSEGRVDFCASYKLKGSQVDHRESALFKKENDTWYFVDGSQIAGPPVRREGPKLGRNDPCTCGSGKKYKKCCGKAA
jgi:SEC-C motif-containing protein